MAFVFIAFGIFFGAAAAIFTFISSGSILLALASYSAVGTMATMAMIAAVYFIAMRTHLMPIGKKALSPGILPLPRLC